MRPGVRNQRRRERYCFAEAVAGEDSPVKKTAFGGCSVTFLWARGSAGQGAFRSPPGPLRGLAAVGCIPLNRFPVEGKEQLSLCIRRCKNHLINKPAPPLSNGGATDCQKTFRRCRRGRSPSDFSSCKPALPADGWLFERKAKSLCDRCFSSRKNSALLGR